MSDSDPAAPIPPPEGGLSDLHGLDPGELLARGLHTVKPSIGASAWEPPTPEEVGRLLPQYRIESLIGRGGMGAVYKGIQLNLDRPVAIKLLPAEIAEDAQFVTRFKREARTLARLQHARIVTIHDFGQSTEGHLYFVMEYVDGSNLRHILKGPGLNPEQALVIVGQLCDALQAAHAQGIVHRDLKPENVLVTRDGGVKLVDFGLSRPPLEGGTTQLTQSDVVMGTPNYMAPEQETGAATADHRSDIFALGIMFYEMLTGQPPRGAFEPPSSRVQVDVRIDEVVIKALQSAPERRYQQASEMKTDVDYIRSTPAPAVPGAKPTPPAPPARKRSRALVMVGIGLLLLGLASYLIWLKTGPAFSHSPAGARSEAPAAAGDASLLSASQGQPFVNTLGMKFVPVPIPTQTPNSNLPSPNVVLFSVWDTRVQDYQAYARDKKVDDAWTHQQKDGVPVSVGPLYPVVGVNWDDANAFCRWLTEQEAAKGKLPKGMKYRLPTDEEWSYAVGLPKEEGATPNDRNRSNSAVFPWGLEFPPSKSKGGNYADAAFYEKFPQEPSIENYNDGYATTSPVGSFAANPYGLYDMGGNVWQWCGDLYEPADANRVMRGAGWQTYNRLYLLSVHHHRRSPVIRANDGGFRCVIATGDAPFEIASAAAGQTLPSASQDQWPGLSKAGADASKLPDSSGDQDNMLTPAEQASGWQLLFNGKDLSGWKAGQPEFWSVRDAAITITSTYDRPAPDANLIYVPEDFSDFEFRFKCRISPQPDCPGFTVGSVRFRGFIKNLSNLNLDHYYQLVLDKNYLITGGFSGKFVNVDPGSKAIIKATNDSKKGIGEQVGSISQMAKNSSPLVSTQWNDYVVIARANNCCFFVNGLQTIDVTDQTPDRIVSGVLAFGILNNSHGMMQFKDIKIKKLTAASSPSPTAALPAKETPSVPQRSAVGTGESTGGVSK